MNEDDDKNLPDQGVEDDSALWEKAMSDVQKFDHKLDKNLHSGVNKGKILPKGQVCDDCRVDIVQNMPQSRGKEVDRRSFDRFRRGEMDIDGRIDLHGMNQDRAHYALNDFVLRSYAQGKRCLLVITGKGSGKSDADMAHWTESNTGVLKRSISGWLDMAPIGPLVLQSSVAQPKDGGSGALYVLLRRRRD